MKKDGSAFIIIVMFILLLVMCMSLVSCHTESMDKNMLITHKEVVGSTYTVYAIDDEGHTKTYSVANSFVTFRFNAAELYNALEEGKCYDIVSYESRFFSQSFPSIEKIRQVYKPLV